MRDLDFLNLITDEGYAKTFMHNLNAYFRYSIFDIPKILEDRDIEPLKELRESLLKTVSELFHEYAGKTAINRQNRKLVISDIMALGKTAVFKKIDEKLDEAYKPEPILNLSDPEEMIKFVMKLKTDQDAANISLRNANNTLKAENDELKTRLAICEANLGIYTGSNHTELLESQVPSDLGEQESDSDSDSDNSSVQPQNSSRIKRTLRNAKVIKASDHPVSVRAASNPVPVQAATKSTYAFIGNVRTDCTSESIFEHITENIKVPVKRTDIKELSIKSNTKAFMVTVPQGLLNKVISNWPVNIKAEPYTLPKPKNSARRPAKGTPKRQQKFRGSFKIPNRTQQNWNWNRFYEPHREYQDRYQPHYRY